MTPKVLQRQNRIYLKPFGFFLLLTIFSISQFSFQILLAAEITSNDECILQLISSGPDSMTIGETKAQCYAQKVKEPVIQELQDKGAGIVEERLALDDKNILTPFSLMAHNFQRWDSTVYAAISDNDISFDNTELQFQLSIKTPLAISNIRLETCM